MVRTLLLLVALPFGAVAAQDASIHLTISSRNQSEFRVVQSPNDSTQRPLFGRGRLELAAENASPRDAAGTVEVVSMDSLSMVHVEATRDGRVIASADGGYLLVRRELGAVAIEARSSAPASVMRTLRKP